MSEQRREGVVKWFSASKGYGFLIPDGSSEEVFAHYSALEMQGYRELAEGQRVSFLVCEGPRGRYAESVRVLLP